MRNPLLAIARAVSDGSRRHSWILWHTVKEEQSRPGQAVETTTPGSQGNQKQLLMDQPRRVNPGTNRAKCKAPYLKGGVEKTPLDPAKQPPMPITPAAS